MEDVTIDTFRGSVNWGMGKALHIPTGYIEEFEFSGNERSARKNAIERLRKRVGALPEQK